MTDVTDIIGSAALLRWEGRFVFEIQKPAKWGRDGDSLKIGVGCIGGGIEDGEGPVDAIHREAMEEIGCALTLEEAVDPFLVTSDGTMTSPGAWLTHEGVSYFWAGYLPEHRPDTCVAVFHGTVANRPSPIDLPAILLLSAHQTLALLEGKKTVANILDLGGELIHRESVPHGATLDLVGTTAFLSRIHGLNEALFYRCFSSDPLSD